MDQLQFSSSLENSSIYFNYAERIGTHCSSRFVSGHSLMICVRCESEHAELFLSMYYCDNLAVSPGGAAAASPGGGAAARRRVPAAKISWTDGADRRGGVRLGKAR